MGANDQPTSRTFLDSNRFSENVSKVPLDELRPYAGKHVAWNWEGTRILACGEDEEVVALNLRAQGIPLDEVVFSFVDPMDGTSLL
jgi:hypothetical protein